jgi:ribosomal RNA-processing protein 7
VFVINLPVDMTERDLRVVFSTWGVVESIEFDIGSSGDVLAKAVQGLPEDESDFEDEGDSENADGPDAAAAADNADHSEPTFISNLPRAQRPRKKRPVTIPEVSELVLSPRQTAYGPSGLRTAHITYLDPTSITAADLPSTPISIEKYGTDFTQNPNPTGLAYYAALHASLRPALGTIKAYADSAMARFDHLHSLLLSSRAKEQGAGALVDEDGFTVVVRGGRYGRTGGRGDGVGGSGVAVAKKGFGSKTAGSGKGGAAELPDFYRFQKTDRKRKGGYFTARTWAWDGCGRLLILLSDLADLRSKFEEDKIKVDAMRKAKRFTPY